MHRFYLPEAKSETSLTLTEREAHHAANVLRIRKGEIVTVLNGTGAEFLCEAQEVSKRNVTLAIREKKTVAPLPYQLTLLQAVPKGKLMETIIQKATELGVSRIVPLLTERVITQVGDDRAEEKREKWQQVAIEAIKQCGQPWLPKVEAPMTPADFLRRGNNFDLPLIASLQFGSQHPRAFFSNYREMNQRAPKSVCIWVGPEGDFTPAEVEQIIASGVMPITLGRLVLRCETAAIYCLSVISYELQSEE
ncbi:MAG: 16S rRNA (uracil(1498)-N(3))-methyltransferase [Verrucomicrobia bacterium]|nr:16S rRNA (uracil(1498)-N(3))-methyltransferase [Verrucomicrobiota bacterium]